jgi:sec-independent protein translocase protein TatA
MVATILLGIIGMQELILIGIIVLLFFGGRKIPELMKGLGKGVKSFKDGMKEEDEEEISSQKSEK